jgi:hypothetical protein
VSGNRIDIRHVAALAFVGWYLLLPPPGPDRDVDTSLPLTVWFRAKQDYASKADWESDKTALINMPRANPSDPKEQSKLHGERADICVSAEDPRFKEKP